MRLTSAQSISLSNELGRVPYRYGNSVSWSLDDIFDMRDHVYNEYGGYLHSTNGQYWHITFEDPKYETLFTLKHPPMPSFQQDV
jgi:hypothetical protein